MANANDLGAFSVITAVKVDYYSPWGAAEVPNLTLAMSAPVVGYYSPWLGQDTIRTDQMRNAEYDSVPVRSVIVGVKMRGHLLADGFETWVRKVPDTNNPSGLPIEDIVVSDKWEG